MLSVCHLNIRSLSKHFAEFKHWSSLNQHDIICISETWLNNSHYNSNFLMPEYNFIRQDRGVDSRGGGLAFYVNKKIKFDRVDLANCQGAELLAIKITNSSSEMNVVLVYNPPQAANQIVDQFEKLFCNHSQFTKKQTLIIGDFNIDWSSETKLKDRFETLMSLYSYQQLINGYTRCFKNSKTIIDLMFSNFPDIVVNQKVIRCDISDHFAISCQLRFKPPKTSFSYVTKRDFRKFDAAEFYAFAEGIDFSQIESHSCVNKAAESLEEKVCNIVDQFAPFKTQRLKNKKTVCWKSPTVSALIKNSSDAFDKFVDSGYDKSSQAWIDYKAIRNKKNNAVRDAKKDAMAKILNDQSLSQWEKIKIFKGTNTDVENRIDTLQINDTKFSDADDIANGLNHYFSTIGEKLNESARNACTNINSLNTLTPKVFEFQRFSFTEVSNCEVSKVLHSLKARKTGGTTQIPAYIYQIIEPFILNPLTHIINLSLKTNKFPDVWKQAMVIPIFKTGARDQPGNYRPISLLPILSKVLEKIASFQMREYLENNKLISERQFGFRSGTSTDQILLQLVNKIRHLLTQENSRSVTLSALDIKKAFDCVNHNILLTKMQHLLNFSSSAISFIKNYLTNRVQAMKANGVLSTTKSVFTGVPQGSVLGPLLFIAFINDLAEMNDCYLFADDCLLLTSGPNSWKATANMEQSITSASKWYDQNLLVMNASKTDVMTVSKSKDEAPHLKFQAIAFKQSDKIKYLGVILDKNLNFKPHIKKMKQKLYPIITSFERNRKFLSSSLAALWYKGLIRPNLEYCAPLLFCSNDYIKKEILKIENRCLKIIDFNQHKTETRKSFNIYTILLRHKYLYMLTYYKLINELVPIIDKKLMPEKLKSVTRLAVSDGLRISNQNVKFSLNGFGAKLYNDLPRDIKLSQNLKSFKSAIKNHILTFD